MRNLGIGQSRPICKQIAVPIAKSRQQSVENDAVSICIRNGLYAFVVVVVPLF
jgi:hypothetical protein